MKQDVTIFRQKRSLKTGKINHFAEQMTSGPSINKHQVFLVFNACMSRYCFYLYLYFIFSCSDVNNNNHQRSASCFSTSLFMKKTKTRVMLNEQRYSIKDQKSSQCFELMADLCANVLCVGQTANSLMFRLLKAKEAV